MTADTPRAVTLVLQSGAVKLGPELAKAQRLSKAVPAAYAARDEAIWECAQAGHSFRQIGKVVGLTHTHIARIVAEQRTVRG